MECHSVISISMTQNVPSSFKSSLKRINNKWILKTKGNENSINFYLRKFHVLRITQSKAERMNWSGFFLSFFLFFFSYWLFFFACSVSECERKLITVDDTPKNADDIERTILVCVVFSYFANSVAIFLRFGLMPEKLSCRAVVIDCVMANIYSWFNKGCFWLW